MRSMLERVVTRVSDTIQDVLRDADDVFRFVEGSTHQARAHEYISRRDVQREPGDTATLCAVRDMISRASRCECAQPSDEARDALLDGARQLLRLATELG